MRTALLVIGIVIQVIGLALFLRAGYRFLTFRKRATPPFRNPLAGLSLSEKKRIGRLSTSGTVVAADDADRTRALIEHQLHWFRNFPQLVPALIVMGLGGLITKAGQERLNIVGAVAEVIPPVGLIVLQYLFRRSIAKREATARANGWSVGDRHG